MDTWATQYIPDRGAPQAPGLLSFDPHLSPNSLHLVILPCEGYSMRSWFPEEALPFCSPERTTGERRTANEKKLPRCAHSGPKRPGNWLENLHGGPDLSKGHSPFPRMGATLLILHRVGNSVMQKMLWEVRGTVAGVRLPSFHCRLQVSLTSAPRAGRKPRKGDKG